ncbi:3-alpha-hydroxysteroid dehydrogenase [Enterococcus silesiacus]|uniref:3-alpha-hydroxysteroid dehydrogenase n=1 Tax=Enterococcus silesiacus TaxID=332949 RepID=A0A0S3K7T5_9ENTE|nr:glucose 1-dehydrogenase [Enterococcus silesiacus]ALS00364.1 3-alpha-hydroxysteroid dehydrogenase [Enterococcus silesiacus]OJG93358.1 short-chain dehydrogenase/reductase SDR [Enterococcus silesiacus]
MRLAGKIALITGASMGMGKEHASLFIKEGATVYIADINDAKGQETADDLGDKAHFIHLDVTNEDQWQAAIEQIAKESGSLDVLVNNAGISMFNSLINTSQEEFMKTIEINQLSVFLGMKASVPLMEKSDAASIINISSIEGFEGSIGGYGYVSSKFAVRGLTKCAALEFADKNIRVNSVHPGGVVTPMVTEATGEQKAAIEQFQQTIPMKRMAEPKEISKLVLFLASDDSSYSTGSEFIADGGILA